MERGTLRERDRLFVRRASLVDFGMVDRGMLSIRAYACMHGGVRLLSVLIPLNKKHITFPQLVVHHSYYVITTVYPILTSPGYEIKFSFKCDPKRKIFTKSFLG